MHDITLTVTGNVVSDVSLRFSASGDPVASFRIACTPRRFDRASDRWVDSDTHYFGVSCWRDMAQNVVQSVTKGMPIVVHGRLRSREVERPCGESSHRIRYQDIEARSVGPDLSRGVATFTRVKRQSVVESEERLIADLQGAALALAEIDDLPAGVDPETGEIHEDFGRIAADEMESVPAGA
ncbi:MAG: single-stranded DNA-binding protein [Candidatus Nanopelagicales bacterium]|nr:single-stranded DNA-binding protein [Candidatus Nanopelagicales bacterium]